MVDAPKILKGEVFHKRMMPKINSFRYKSYYLLFDIEQSKCLKNKLFGVDRFNLMSFYHKDHYPKNDCLKWIKELVDKYNPNLKIERAYLLAMPRVLGYVFNPVSFWFCVDDDEKLKAVVAEVRNTFGERHNYVCCNKDGSDITQDDIIEAEKVFHVSPFIKREGKYQFRFKYCEKNIGVYIDYFDSNNNKLLITSVVGKFIKYNKMNLLKVFFTYPFLTLKTIMMIHYQALILCLKKIKYIKKPKQLVEKNSSIIED